MRWMLLFSFLSIASLALPRPGLASEVLCEQLSHPESRVNCIEERDRRAAATNQAAESERGEAVRLGALRWYLTLAPRRYRACSQQADSNLSDGAISKSDLVEIGQCAAAMEADVASAVRPALDSAPDPLKAQVKALHAYVVASARALSDFNLSVVEGRQDRAARRAGLDERVTLIELDL